jgi:hypothetical protein
MRSIIKDSFFPCPQKKKGHSSRLGQAKNFDVEKPHDNAKWIFEPAKVYLSVYCSRSVWQEKKNVVEKNTRRKKGQEKDTKSPWHCS